MSYRFSALVSLLLASSTLAVCSGSEPSNWAVALWLATLISPLPALLAADRRGEIPAAARIFSRREVALVTAVAAITLLWISHDLTDWRWAGTPDEVIFFNFAKPIALGDSTPFLLSQTGVFDVHPVLSSAYQALVMRLFGVDLFGWRLASAIAVAASIPFLYLLTRELFSRRAARIAIVLFSMMPLVIGFGHLGYNNSQVYPISTAALGLFAWAHRRNSRSFYYLAGIIAGLGFYTFYAARIVLLLIVVLAACLKPRDARLNWRGLGLALWGFLLAITPILAYGREALVRMLSFTSAVSTPPLGVGFGDTSGANFAWQFFISMVHPLWYPMPHHFQSSPIVDPIAGTLAVIGFLLAIRNCGHDRKACFLVIAWLLSALLVGATSDHPRPPLTRLLFLSPLVAIFAAMALDRWNPRPAILTAVVAASVVWSAATLQYNLRVRYHGHGDGTTAELIRLTSSMNSQQTLVYLQRAGVAGSKVEEIFPLHRHFERFVYFSGLSPAGREILEQLEPPFTVVSELRDYQEIEQVQQLLAGRFPNSTWVTSDPGHFWGLLYLSVPADEISLVGVRTDAANDDLRGN